MKNFLLKNENAIYYECSFSCDNVIYLSLDGENYFITDSRYTIEAKQYSKNCEVITTSNLIQKAKDILHKNKVKKIILDPYDFTVKLYNQLIEKTSVKFVFQEHFSMKKRMIKSTSEIKLLKKAMKLGRDGFDKFELFLHKKGWDKTEQFLAYKAQTFLSDFGKYDLSFDPIIAIGKNSAKPHALPTKRKYSVGDMLLFDGGIKYKRYCSDRTVTFGDKFRSTDKALREQYFSRKEEQKVYDIVLKAHDIAIKKAKVGMKASQIDALARDVIEKAGYGKYFIHSTGHGVGLDIHEYPFISSKSDIIIKENMVFTIEPAIYLPNNFGVRIEDTIVMSKGKAKIL